MPTAATPTAEPAPAARHRTHQTLLDAGVAVAEREGLGGLSVNRVVAQAGVAKGTFYVHFADREAFVDALHEAFHERVRGAVAAATAGVPAGAERLVRGVEAYLDVCLADRAIKALALEARAAAQLLAAKTSEIAIRELEAGRRLPAARRSLRRFLGLVERDSGGATHSKEGR
jgi:TetR/AcrR family transcriptional repressor of nem operon